MSDADKAFARAEDEIAKAIAEGQDYLALFGDDFRDLETIPDSIAEITGLRALFLHNTQVADLSPLTGIAGLQALNLDNTQVADLSPLAEIAGLQTLLLSNTQVADLSPLAGIAGLQTLFLKNTQVADLSPLDGNAGLKELYLNDTQVADLSPLDGNAGLQELYLNDTEVADLSPLAGITGLQLLVLENTQIADLRTLLGMSGLLEERDAPLSNGIWFRDCLAMERDPELRRLSEIENAKERTEKTLAYLRTLPPYPEPLPWQSSEADLGAPLADPPEVEGLPEVRVTGAGIDVVPGTATAEDLTDPIKSRLYDQLGQKLDALLRQGNRYPELAGPAQAMRALVEAPFAEADIMGLHLHLLAMEDVRTEDAARPGAERMDADCRLALNDVLRIAPPITIGHPDVALIEERNAAFRNERVSEAQAESERRLAASVGRAKDHATEPARALGETLGRSATEGRLAQARKTFVMGVVMGAGGLIVGGALAEVGAQGAGWALNWLAAHKDEIWTAAQGWGDTAFRWVKDMLTHLFGPKRL